MSRELDREIAEMYFGWKWKRDQNFHTQTHELVGRPWRWLVAPDSMFAGLSNADMTEEVREQLEGVPHYSTDPAASKLLLLKLRELGYEIHAEIYPVSVMEDPRSTHFDHSGVPFYVCLIRRVGTFARFESRTDSPEESLALCAKAVKGGL